MTTEELQAETRRRLAEARKLVHEIQVIIRGTDMQDPWRDMCAINGKAIRAGVLLACVEDDLPKPAAYSRPPEEGD